MMKLSVLFNLPKTWFAGLTVLKPNFIAVGRVLLSPVHGSPSTVVPTSLSVLHLWPPDVASYIFSAEE